MRKYDFDLLVTHVMFNSVGTKCFTLTMLQGTLVLFLFRLLERKPVALAKLSSDVKDRDQLFQLLKHAQAWYLVQPETHHSSLDSFIDKGDTDQTRHPTKVS